VVAASWRCDRDKPDWSGRDIHLSPKSAPTTSIISMSTRIQKLSSQRGMLQKARELPVQEWAAITAGVVAAVIVGMILRGALHQGLTSDFPADVAFTAHGLRTGVFPGDLLFQVLNATLAGFSTETRALNISLFVVLGMATGVKVWLSARFVIGEDAAVNKTSLRGVPLTGAVVAAALCSVAFCLPAEHYYLGEVPPNVWHNPSTILLIPLAVGLFWASLLFLRDGDSKYLWLSLILGAFNISAKPSFVLCFLPVFPIFAFMRFGWDRRMWRAILLASAILGMLGLQYVYVYVVDPSGSSTTSSSGIEIAPFVVWKSYTSDIPRAILASYLFPIVALLLAGKVVWQRRAVRYAAALATVGLIEYALLAEGGARAVEGNFTWQAMITQYILFLALVAALFPWLRSQRWGIRQAVITLAFGVHVWAGIHYLAHWFATKSFV
jgi:hypothetical protein